MYTQDVKANRESLRANPPAKNHGSRSRPGVLSSGFTTFRTNKHFTLKENLLKCSDLDDFVGCYNPKHRHERKEAGRFRSFTYEELTKRDKLNLEIFRLKDFAPHFSEMQSSRVVSLGLASHAPLRASFRERAITAVRSKGIPW